MIRRFAAQWDNYAKTMPADAGAVQIQETRRAFYAGGASLLYALVSILTDDVKPTDQDIQAMEDLKAEFEAFTLDVVDGRA
jgi:hypothetical protein